MKKLIAFSLVAGMLAAASPSALATTGSLPKDISWPPKVDNDKMLFVRLFGVTETGTKILLSNFKLELPQKLGKNGKAEYLNLPVTYNSQKDFVYTSTISCNKGKCDETKATVPTGMYFSHVAKSIDETGVGGDPFRIDVQSVYNEVLGIDQVKTGSNGDGLLMIPLMRHFDIKFSAIIKKNTNYTYLISKGSCVKNDLADKLNIPSVSKGDCLSLYMELLAM